MEDLCKEGIVEVNLGAVVILKELSENSLKIKVKRPRVDAWCRVLGAFCFEAGEKR